MGHGARDGADGLSDGLDGLFGGRVRVEDEADHGALR